MTANDETAIRELVASWLAATKAGDIATVLDLMTDDVVFLVAGEAPFGKAEFAAAAEKMQGVTFEAMTSEIREVEIAGHLAYLRSHIEMTVVPPGGTPVRRSGPTLTILRKGEDGRWRLARDANLLTVRR